MPDAPEDDPVYVGHFVWLDDSRDASFFTTDPAKADEAVRILGAALGIDRVSAAHLCESDLDVWRRTVQIWANDPRINSQANDQ